MAAAPVIFPTYESKREAVRLDIPATEDIARVVILEDQPLFCDVLVDDPVTREAQSKQARITHLKKLRNGFGIVAAVFLVLALISLVLHLPYEPATALFACTFGTFLVFLMKVKDGRG